jgi:ABC-2 type transport system ATP-binding protein
LLGPNGAGKTTTVQILSTLIGADGGDASVAGHDVAREPDAVRDVIGVTGSPRGLPLTGERTLPRADLCHRAAEAGGWSPGSSAVHLLEVAKPAVTYSGGSGGGSTSRWRC